MLPVVDRPLIQYSIDEARAAGIEQFCMITGRGKTELVEYFDIAYELEATLRERGKMEALEALKPTTMEPGSIVSVRQQEPLGLGHAIWCARSFIGDDPFAILLPDDIILAKTPCLKQLADAYHRTGGNVVAVTEVPPEHTNRYGILKVGKEEGNLVEVTGLVEKPAPEEAPSNLAVLGRYILPATIFDAIQNTKPGSGGEIQLTDAMAQLLADGTPVHAIIYRGHRYDTGMPLGYLQAVVQLAVKRPGLGAEFKAWLIEFVGGTQG